VISPTGIVVPVLGREGDALVVGTPCERTALLAAGTPVHDVQVVIDAGHGGPEPGAVGPSGLSETEINLAIANYAKEALEARGISAILTRTGEYRMTLEARARVVRAVGPALFVSVHHNAEPDGPFPRPGSETYYQIASPDSKRASGILYEELIAAFAPFDAQWVADSDAGAKYRKGSSGDDYYGILRRTQGTPAVLSEALFVSNPSEEALLARDDVRRAEAEGIAKAAERFLTTDDAGSGFTEPYPREAPAGGGGGKGPSCVDPALT
jgi:N-acetylmuramoyl-L-alanine amidase